MNERLKTLIYALPEMTRQELEERLIDASTKNLECVQNTDLIQLRDDIDSHSSTLDIVSESDQIQILGSITGRINSLLNNP